jgi:L-seryl-tRNA(Ser) seleniumtransferase
MSLVLDHPSLGDLYAVYPRGIVRAQASAVLDELREGVVDGRPVPEGEELFEFLSGRVRERLDREFRPTLRTLVNATGVIVFTNAGRAPLGPSVAAYVAETAAAYSNLEYSLERGERGRRDHLVEGRLRTLTGAEAGTVCNNAAAALLLILNTLANGRKVLVSRGELIEIGGSFRLPAVMEKSGAILREVGTTNRTRLADYQDALDDDTALILKVHPSNYRIVGFTDAPSLEEMVGLARRSGRPLVYDVGSGLLQRSELPVVRDEPAVADVIHAGTDLACFSGDKLLGGPQAGVIVGRAELVDQLRRNPLMRALRVDKLGYAALERTLAVYEQGRERSELPVWRMLVAPVEEIRARAEAVCGRLGSGRLEGRVKQSWSVTGGGSAPQERIPSWVVAVRVPEGVERLEGWLRRFRVPILGRIEDDELCLDLRTVFPWQDELLVEALTAWPGDSAVAGGE